MSSGRGVLRIIIPWDSIRTGKGLHYTSSTSFVCMFPQSPQYVKGDRAWAKEKRNIDLGYIDLDLAWIQWPSISAEELLKFSNNYLGYCNPKMLWCRSASVCLNDKWLFNCVSSGKQNEVKQTKTFSSSCFGSKAPCSVLPSILFSNFIRWHLVFLFSSETHPLPNNSF